MLSLTDLQQISDVEKIVGLGNSDKQKTSKKLSYSEKKIKQVMSWISQGRGQGRGEEYVPWIRITRGYSSPVSHQVFAQLSIHKRSHHFLSKLEHHTALQLAYLGAVELRECLPMWPFEHKHPIDTQEQKYVPGLLDIAKEVGIEHGNYVGTDVPYVASLDMLVTVQWQGSYHHIGVSCKPDEILKSKPRAQERTTLDEIYCATIGARHIKEGGANIDLNLVRNLKSYRPSMSEIQNWSGTQKLFEFSKWINDSSSSKTLHEAITNAGKLVKVDSRTAGAMWRVAVWLKLIDQDLAQPLSMLKPIRRGRDHSLLKLAKHYLGV